MRMWGMISDRDIREGFDLIMDDEGYLILVANGESLARYDPVDYTLTGLCREVEAMLRQSHPNLVATA